MSLNLKNLISGAQKVRYTIRRKTPQVNIRLMEKQDPKPDLVIGPIWSDKAVHQIQIVIKFSLPGTAYYLDLKLNDNRTGWPLHSEHYQNGQPIIIKTVVGGGQILSLEFRLRNQSGQFPKVGLIYQVNDIQVQSLNKITNESFHQTVTLNHRHLNQLPVQFKIQSIKKTQIEPVVRWLLDQHPTRQCFFESAALIPESKNLISNSDQPIFDQTQFQFEIEKNHSDWNQNQQSLQNIIKESNQIADRLTQLEKIRNLQTDRQRTSFINNHLAKIDLLFQLKSALIQESYQMSLVLHKSNSNSVEVLKAYLLVLSRDRLKIEVLLEELNQALSQAWQSADQSIILDTEYDQLHRRQNSLAAQYQTAIETGQNLLDQHRCLLIKPVIEIHQKAFCKKA